MRNRVLYLLSNIKLFDDDQNFCLCKNIAHLRSNFALSNKN